MPMKSGLDGRFQEWWAKEAGFEDGDESSQFDVEEAAREAWMKAGTLAYGEGFTDGEQTGYDKGFEDALEYAEG